MFVGCAPAILRPSGLLSALRPQDVFATSLYTGTGASQTINNGLDLAGKGGLVWEKIRSIADSHILVDTLRGAGVRLATDGTGAEASSAVRGVQGFLSNGYLSSPVTSPNTMVGWSFRRASKFFDIVTYTGDGTSGRVIPHALGIKPGMIIVKKRSTAGNWAVYQRSLGATMRLLLDTIDAAVAVATAWNNTEPTESNFTLGTTYNASGDTYVAYLFAHDPDTTNGIVQCGAYAANSSGNATVTLGWQPQFVLVKSSSTTGQWVLLDAGRGPANYLLANTSAAEATYSVAPSFTATGFTDPNAFAGANQSAVYLAIRAPI